MWQTLRWIYLLCGPHVGGEIGVNIAVAEVRGKTKITDKLSIVAKLLTNKEREKKKRKIYTKIEKKHTKDIQKVYNIAQLQFFNRPYT